MGFPLKETGPFGQDPGGEAADVQGVRDRRIVVFFYGSMAAALAVGALQMFRVQGGWLTDYGADLFGTAWLYAMFRQGRTIFRRGRPLSPGAAGTLG